MKKNGSKCTAQKPSAFAARAERALKPAARNVKAEQHAFKLPVIVWKHCKVERTRMIIEVVRKYSAAQGVSENDALNRMEEKSKEFLERSAEVYAKTRRVRTRPR